jgi:hypothetical protein
MGNIAECRQMIEAAGGPGASMSIRNLLFLPGRYQAVGRTSQFGPVMAFLDSAIGSVATEWLAWAGKSGPEWFLLPHTVDLARWLLGQEVRRVFATGRKQVLASRGIDAYDMVQAQLVMEDGVATLESSWILPSGWRAVIQMEVDIQGTEGKLEIVCDQEGLQLTRERLDTPFFLDPWTTEAVRGIHRQRPRQHSPAPGRAGLHSRPGGDRPIAPDRRGGSGAGMIPKERVKLALAHQQPHIVPYQFNFTLPARQKMVAAWGPDFADRIGNHLAYAEAVAPGGWAEVAPDRWQDEWGVIWNRRVDKDIGVTEGMVLPEPTDDLVARSQHRRAVRR